MTNKPAKVIRTVSKSAQDWQNQVEKLQLLGYKIAKKDTACVMLKRTVKGA